jgi:hypothetical protein
LPQAVRIPRKISLQDDGSPVGFANCLSEVSDLDAAHRAADDGAKGRQQHWEKRFSDQTLEHSQR